MLLPIMLSKRKGYNAIPDLSLANGFLSLLVVQYGHLPLTKRWCEFSLQGNHDKVVRFFPCSWSREGEKGGQKCQKRLLKRKNERAPWEVTIVHEGEEDSNSSVASFDSLILALFRLLLPRGRAPFLAAKKIVLLQKWCYLQLHPPQAQAPVKYLKSGPRSFQNHSPFPHHFKYNIFR